MPRAREDGPARAASHGDRPRVAEYWSWLAVALFLLVTVDVLTTLFAAARYGRTAEANPVVRWLLGQGTAVLVAANVAAVVLVVGVFAGLVRLLRRTPSPYDRYFALAVEVWLGLLVAAGLGVFANNLAVVLLGRGLL